MAHCALPIRLIAAENVSSNARVLSLVIFGRPPSVGSMRAALRAEFSVAAEALTLRASLAKIGSFLSNGPKQSQTDDNNSFEFAGISVSQSGRRSTDSCERCGLACVDRGEAGTTTSRLARSAPGVRHILETDRQRFHTVFPCGGPMLAIWRPCFNSSFILAWDRVRDAGGASPSACAFSRYGLSITTLFAV